MKTLTFVLSLAFLLGVTAFSFAGNHPANPSKSNAEFATKAGPVKANPWHDNVLSSTGSVVVQKAGNGICPVMNHRITSKHNAVIALSNGKNMEVCCPVCKQEIEKNLAKYEAYQF